MRRPRLRRLQTHSFSCTLRLLGIMPMHTLRPQGFMDTLRHCQHPCGERPANHPIAFGDRTMIRTRFGSFWELPKYVLGGTRIPPYAKQSGSAKPIFPGLLCPRPRFRRSMADFISQRRDGKEFPQNRGGADQRRGSVQFLGAFPARGAIRPGKQTIACGSRRNEVVLGQPLTFPCREAGTYCYAFVQCCDES